MGGAVAVTVRLESGEEYRMHRWTNSLPWFFNNLSFFERDSKHIREYLSQWEGMRDDWLKNKKTKKYEFEMTPFYAPYPAALAPESYGIVVFDFLKNAVVSCQGYTSFARCNVTPHWYQPEEADCQIELYKAGRVKAIKYLDEKTRSFKDYPVPKKLSEFKQFYEDNSKLSKLRMARLELDTSPFVIHNFCDDIKGFKAAKKAILDLGFKLTKQDEKIWTKFIKEREE